MIDIECEQVLSLREAARTLPKLRGKHVHLATLHRWCSRGVRGVVLESIRLGGSRVTSKEALRRFVDQLTHPEAVTRPPPPSRQREIDRAEREADALGL